MADTEHTGFPQFASLPNETKDRIFHLAMRKPSLHYIQIEKKEDVDGLDWSIVFRPIPKGNDTSAYRWIAGLRRVCKASKKAVSLATFAPQTFGVQVPNTVDGEHDLVCFQIPVGYRSGRMIWNPVFEFVPPFMDANRVSARFGQLKHVAVKNKMGRSSYCGQSSSAFYCYDGDPEHAGLPMCPEELAAFLARFTSLESFYLIFTPQTRSGKDWAVNFKRSWVATPIHERENRVFYDAKFTYLNIPANSFAAAFAFQEAGLLPTATVILEARQIFLAKYQRAGQDVKFSLLVKIPEN